MSDVKKKLTPELVANLVANKVLEERKLIFDKKGHLPVWLDHTECKILEENEALTYLFKVGRAVKGDPNATALFSKHEMLDMSHALARAVLKSLSIRPEFHLEDEIKPFAFKSDSSFTYCRIPFDPSPVVRSTPHWDRLMLNFDNVAASKMWIGSLFSPTSDRSQYWWLYGLGGNGKSTVAMILAEMLGNFVRFEQVPCKEDKYWTHGLIGKRLIILDDCNNYGFVKTGLFKALTGGSKVRVEQKFADPYDVDLTCKFLFTSNELPMISGETADQRRIILSCAQNKEKFDFDPEFKARLKKELPAFISNCLLDYKSTCSDGRPIPTDARSAEKLAEIFDEEIEAWVNHHFDYSEISNVRISEFRDMLSKTRLDARRVYKFLEKKGITRQSCRDNKDIYAAVIGLRRKLGVI